jgi:mono/diheme cytochrome c family protein
MSRKPWWGLAAAAALAAAPMAAPAETRFPADDIAKGHAVYDKSCVHCHGFNMVNSGTTVYDLRRFPVDDPDRFSNSVTNGKGNMPSYKEALTPEQIKLLWAYVGSRGGKEP